MSSPKQHKSKSNANSPYKTNKANSPASHGSGSGSKMTMPLDSQIAMIGTNSPFDETPVFSKKPSNDGAPQNPSPNGAAARFDKRSQP